MAMAQAAATDGVMRAADGTPLKIALALEGMEMPDLYGKPNVMRKADHQLLQPFYTALFTKQQDDIDIDCGGIVEGLESVDQVGERIFQLMLDTASGRQTKSEGHGYGQNEFVPWQLGAVM